MFDIGWQEIFILAVISIIVVGPKDLPRAIKTIAQVVRKARGMARDLQSGIDDVVREAELDDIKLEAEKVAKFDFEKEISNTIDPDKELEKEMDMEMVEAEMNSVVSDYNGSDAVSDPAETTGSPEVTTETAIEDAPAAAEETADTVVKPS